jgi:S1-C subfamily serine protease
VQEKTQIMNKLSIIAIIGILLSINCFSQNNKNLPTSTKLTIENAESYNQSNELMNVCMIFSKTTKKKGSGFLTKSGYIITNYHVIQKTKPNDLLLIFPNGNVYLPKEIKFDSIRDLAALKFSDIPTPFGFELGESSQLKLGHQLYSWGYPLGYNGPSPLLTVGYLAGYRTLKDTTNNKIVNHLVINGAFNSGNSGGALIYKGKVVGVVQSKHAPISDYLLSALKALENNSSGMQYKKTDDFGNVESLSEAQIVAELLIYFRKINQVMIGEAITIDELKNFMSANNITEN